MNYWLTVGAPEQWKTAFEQANTWGLVTRQRHLWNGLAENDVILIYATKPVSGLVGYGTIKNKFKQDKPLWPQEIAEGKVKWPLRFEFNINYCLAPDEWSIKRVTSDALKLKVGIGFHSVEEEFAKQMISLLEPSPIPTAEQALSTHEQLKRKLVEIGKLQGFIAETEYAFDIGKLDVVWRKLELSVPTRVFEIQVGGDIYHALGKLKHAFDLWNSHIFLVATQNDYNKAESLLSGTFHEIGHRIKFIELDKVQELYKRKRDYFDLENELGIIT